MAHSFSFYSKDDINFYRTCTIYALTASGQFFLHKYIDTNLAAKKHRAITTISDNHDYIAILNRIAFNSFYINSFNYDIKRFLSYIAGNTLIEGRFVIESERYIDNIVNIFIIPVRNTEESSLACAMKIRTCQDHCSQKKLKKPWFIVICEDDMHERELYMYLENCKVINKAVICMTKDTYLIEKEVDPFDNLATFEQTPNGLVSDFKRIIF